MKKTAEREQLNDLNNRTLGMVAHDLSNPLTLIQSCTYFLIEEHEEKKIFSEEQFQLVEQIKESSEYMVQIIKDLQDFSSLESDKMTLDVEQTNLVQIIDQSISLNKPAADEKDITISFEPSTENILKNVDANKIQQVLDNLVSNAIKYSYPGSKVMLRIEKGNKEVTMTVQDEGQGIPDEELGTLFQPFSKAGGEATDGKKGTGLGLAIAHNIIKAHGGSIDVESEVGIGSRFIVRL